MNNETKVPLYAFIWSSVIILSPWLLWSGFAGAGTLRTAVMTVSAMAVGVALLFVKRREIVRRDRPVVGYYARFALVVSLFVLFNLFSRLWSEDRLATLFRSYEMIVWEVVVIVTWAVALNRRARYFLLFSFAVGGTLLAVGALGSGLADQFGIFPDMEWMISPVRHPTGRFMFPFGHPAALGGALTFPALLWLAMLFGTVEKKNVMAAIGAGCMLLPCVTGIVMSGTRSSLAGLVAGGFVILVVMLKGRARRLLLVGAGLVFIASSVFLSIKYSTPEKRERIYVSSFGTRLLFSATALRMATDSLLLGHGAGTFAYSSPRFEAKEDFLHGQRGDVVYTTHCEPLQVLAELGLIGLLLWLGLHGMAIRNCLRERKNFVDESDWRRILSLGVAAGVVGIFIETCGSMAIRFGDLFLNYGVILGFAGAWGCCGSKNTVQESTSRGKIIELISNFVIVVLFVLVAVNLVIPSLRAEAAYFLAGRELSEGNVKGAGLLYGVVMAQTRRMETWVRAAQRAALLAEADGEIEKALRLQGLMLRHFPSDPVNRSRYVSLLYRSGKWRRALDGCLDGLKLNPYDYRMARWLSHILAGTDRGTLDRWIAEYDGYSPVDFDFGLCLLNETERDWLRAIIAYEAGNVDDAYEAAEKLNCDEIRFGFPQLLLAQWTTKLNSPFTERKKRTLERLMPLIKKYPASPHALALCAEILLTPPFKSDDAELAYRLIERSMGLGRTIPEVLRIMSVAYILSGDEGLRRQAEYHVCAAVNQVGTDIELRKIKIITLWRLGRKEEAKFEFDRSIRMFRNSTEIYLLEELRPYFADDEKNYMKE